jgi:hypothetical protein
MGLIMVRLPGVREAHRRGWAEGGRAPIFVTPLLDRNLQTHDGSRTIASMHRTPGRALGGRTGLRTIRSAHHDVERRPRWTQSQSAEECVSCSLSIRELVARIPAPCGDHGKN